jgi:hypothetical protein
LLFGILVLLFDKVIMFNSELITLCNAVFSIV